MNEVALRCPWCGLITVAEVVWNGEPRRRVWPTVLPDSHDCEPT